jgi:hypothetical protein
MELLYADVWAGRDCLAVSASIAGIVAGLLVVMAMAVGATTVLALRRYGMPEFIRPALAATVGLIVLTLGGSTAYLLVASPVIHRIAAAPGELVFEGCRGIHGHRERIALGDIEAMSYRSRWSEGRSPRVLHEVVVRLRGNGAVRVIPLSTDPAVSDHAALARHIPAAVLADYAASLRASGAVLPPAIREP